MVAFQKAGCRDYRRRHRTNSNMAGCPGSTMFGGAVPVEERRSASREQHLNLRCDIERVIATLPVELQQICRLLMALDSVAEVASAAGISRTALYRRMGVIRSSFIKARLLDHLADPAVERPGG
jgi:hypothetical protein